MTSHPPLSIPFPPFGAWTLTLGWLGYHVMPAATLVAASGLAAANRYTHGKYKRSYKPRATRGS
jgi:hypothetical protein